MLFSLNLDIAYFVLQTNNKTNMFL